MNEFEFVGYEFNEENAEAKFHYKNGGIDFEESVKFEENGELSNDQRQKLDRALRLAFLLIGTSYYKTWPSKTVKFAAESGVKISPKEAEFLNAVYQDGLSQFAFENNLTRADLAHFTGVENEASAEPSSEKMHGTLVLQSGGKDSLLNATLLNQAGENWSALYIGSSESHPKVLDELGEEKPVELQTITRKLDMENLKKAANLGAKNGHVPVTYIVMSLGVIQAILNGQNRLLTSIGHEGEEPHSIIKSTGEADLPVNHQWSKTKKAEELFADYVKHFIDPDFEVKSPLRQFSELKIAELFVKNCWEEFGRKFSSCNVANYRQQNDNSELHWCGHCAKCANSYLLFAPFLDAEDLQSLFDGEPKDLFLREDLWPEFKGLLGIDGAKKPFECVGEVDELQKAYHLKRAGYADLPFAVPDSDFDIERLF